MGSSNKIIASELNLSEATVKGHMKLILSKLGANDRTHAVTIALKRGIIRLTLVWNECPTFLCRRVN